MKILLSLAFAVLAFCAACIQSPSKPAVASAAQTATPGVEPVTAEQYCQAQHVQCLDQDVHIVLHLPNGTTFDQSMQPPLQPIDHDNVFIFSGQTLYIEADLDGDKLVNLHAVPSITHPQKTLTLSFEQTKLDSSAVPYMMMFHIKNPFDKTLKYHAAAYYSPAAYNKGPEALVKTDVCPILPKLENSETWPNPIFQLTIFGMQLIPTDAKDALVCE